MNKIKSVTIIIGVSLISYFALNYIGYGGKSSSGSSAPAPRVKETKRTQEINYSEYGVVSDYGNYTYDTLGNNTIYASYIASGTDTTWLTADDVVEYYEKRTYNAQNKKIRNV